VKQKHLGVFELGPQNIDLYFVTGGERGGRFYCTPDDTSKPRLKVMVGKDSTWARAVDYLLHEATEFSLMRLQKRYEVAGSWSCDDAAYLFVLTHQDLSEVMSWVSHFAAKALPPLSQAFNAYSRKAKK
jgi:hypothetical protein